VFGTLGMPELILIFVVALLLFGPRKMPDIGRSIGRALGEFRRASNEFKRTIEDEVASEDVREVERDLKGIGGVGKELRDLKRSIESPVETVVKKVLDQASEPEAGSGRSGESGPP